MTFTNEQMVKAIEAMVDTTNETGRLGYAIAVNLRKLRDEADEYLRIRAKAFTDLGEPVGDQMIVKGDNVKVFTERVGELSQVEHDVSVVQVDLDTFTSGGLTSRQMDALMWMIKEG